MFINEFHSIFSSGRESNRLLDALRRVSRLDKRLLLAEEAPGWPEWPPMDPDWTGVRTGQA